jgi:translation initiation factor 2B subunit (eIF-2B alpha/beta/delta family)
LIASRPALSPIANAVSCFIFELYAQEGKGLDSLKGFASSIAGRLVEESEEAALKAAEAGAEAIADKDIVMTCSYSSTICQAFSIAKDKGKYFEVVVAESKYGDRAYGEVMASELRQHSIPVEIIPDEAIVSNAPRVNKVLVGADSILSDGSLINGIPTYELALAAKKSNIPFYAICETAKFSVQSQVELEQGFDKTPPELITGIITEKGTMKPNEVSQRVAGMKRYIGAPFHYSMGK